MIELCEVLSSSRRFFSCFVRCMPQVRQITDPDNRFGITAFSNLCPIPSILFLAFSEIQSRDFLAASPIPGLRSGSNAKAFSTLTYPGVLYRPLLSELCFAIPDELHGKFVGLVWLILVQTSLINEALLSYLLAQVSTCAHDVAKSRRT